MLSSNYQLKSIRYNKASMKFQIGRSLWRIDLRYYLKIENISTREPRRCVQMPADGRLPRNRLLSVNGRPTENHRRQRLVSWHAIFENSLKLKSLRSVLINYCNSVVFQRTRVRSSQVKNTDQMISVISETNKLYTFCIFIYIFTINHRT